MFKDIFYNGHGSYTLIDANFNVIFEGAHSYGSAIAYLVDKLIDEYESRGLNVVENLFLFLLTKGYNKSDFNEFIKFLIKNSNKFSLYSDKIDEKFERMKCLL